MRGFKKIIKTYDDIKNDIPISKDEPLQQKHHNNFYKGLKKIKRYY